MHELALSQSIVDCVLRECEVEKERIRGIGLRIGTLSGVNLSSLEFCMRTVLDQHGMNGAEARIEEAPAVVKCACGRRYRPADMFQPCPECGEFEREIVEGTDLTIEYIEVEDEQD